MFTNLVKEPFADFSKWFHKLQEEYQSNLKNDELDKMVKKGFNELEEQIKYSQMLPGNDFNTEFVTKGNVDNNSRMCRSGSSYFNFVDYNMLCFLHL